MKRFKIFSLRFSGSRNRKKVYTGLYSGAISILFIIFITSSCTAMFKESVSEWRVAYEFNKSLLKKKTDYGTFVYENDPRLILKPDYYPKQNPDYIYFSTSFMFDLAREGQRDTISPKRIYMRILPAVFAVEKSPENLEKILSSALYLNCNLISWISSDYLEAEKYENISQYRDVLKNKDIKDCMRILNRRGESESKCKDIFSIRDSINIYRENFPDIPFIRCSIVPRPEKNSSEAES